MPTFMQYAVAAAHEALQDAAWSPKTSREQEMTVSLLDPEDNQLSSYAHQGVCLGSGIGSLKEQYDTSIALMKGVSL